LKVVEWHKKTIANPGKGHNETFEIVNPVKHTRIAIGVIKSRVPENRDARAIHNYFDTNH
jgi:hypothetical protein